MSIFRYTTEKHELKKGSEGAAGYDICAHGDFILPKESSALISTGIHMAVDPGYYAQVASRSGLAYKFRVTAEAGVIDSDYRGEVKVLLFNHSEDSFKIKDGDRIAQIILIKIADEQFEKVSSLEDTERGSGGFGSTGISG